MQDLTPFPKADEQAFKRFLGELAYPYVEETLNPACRMFLRQHP
jgi:threonine dehydratase